MFSYNKIKKTIANESYTQHVDLWVTLKLMFIFSTEYANTI